MNKSAPGNLYASGSSRPVSEARRPFPLYSMAVVLALIILVPLLTGTALLKSAGKLIVFEVLGTLLLAQVLAQARLRGGVARLQAAALAGPNLPLLLLVALAGVSCALSPFPAFAVPEFLRIAFCALLYFVLVYQTANRPALQMLCDGILFVTAAVSLTGLAEMGTEGAGGQVVSGSFGTHELLGSFLMLLLPLALALGLIDRGEPKRQLAAQVVAVLATACLLTARTRSAWIGEGVSLIVLSFLALRYSVQTGRGGWPALLARRKAFIVGPLLAVILAVGVFLVMSPLGPSLPQRAATLAHVGVDHSFQWRLTMWRGASDMIAQRPLLGWGIGSYPVREAQFTGLGTGSADVLAHGTDMNNVAHNFYLQTAAELGLVGLGLYLAVVALFFVAGLRALPALESGLRKTVLIGSLAAMAGQLVDAASSPAYNFASVSLFQWLLMGVGMYAAGLPARARRRTPEASSEASSGTSFGNSSGTSPSSWPEDSPAPSLPRWARAGLRYASAGVAVIFLGSLIEPTLHAALAADTTPVQDAYNLPVVQPAASSSSSYTGTRNALYATGAAGAAGAAALLTAHVAPALLLESSNRYNQITGQGTTLTGSTFQFRVDPKDNGPSSVNPSFFRYEDPRSGLQLVSAHVTTLAFTGPYRATFQGIGYLSDSSEVHYTVQIAGDKSTPGLQRFTITITRPGQPNYTQTSALSDGGYEFMRDGRVQWANPSRLAAPG